MVTHKIHIHKNRLSRNNMFLIKVSTSCQGNFEPPTLMLAPILQEHSSLTVATALWLGHSKCTKNYCSVFLKSNLCSKGILLNIGILEGRQMTFFFFLLKVDLNYFLAPTFIQSLWTKAEILASRNVSQAKFSS